MKVENLKVIRKSINDIEVKEHDDFGILSIRYFLTSLPSEKSLLRTTGSKMPSRNQILFSRMGGLAWMSTDELWFITEKKDVESTLDLVKNSTKSRFKILVDISCSRVIFSLFGRGWRDTLSKGCPADLSDKGLKPGDIRRTRLGHLPVAIWCANPETAFVVCNRSVRDYLFDWLDRASIDGSSPNYY